MRKLKKLISGLKSRNRETDDPSTRERSGSSSPQRQFRDTSGTAAHVPLSSQSDLMRQAIQTSRDVLGSSSQEVQKQDYSVEDDINDAKREQRQQRITTSHIELMFRLIQTKGPPTLRRAA